MPLNNYLNFVSLLVLATFLNFPTTTEAQGPIFLNKACSGGNTTVNSTFQRDLKTLFSSLTSKANREFYNTTVIATNSIYGLFMCRGDFPSCAQCVLNATHRLSSDSDCSSSKEGVVWYVECMVRYSNRYFFSTVATTPMFSLLNTANIANHESFMKLLAEKVNEAADEAAKSAVMAKKYATKEANISAFQTLYCMAQCTEDLSAQDCRSCLVGAIGQLPSCCEGKQGGRVLVPSCNVRYELYPFYRSTASASGLVPSTNSSGGSSRISSGTIIVAIVVLITVVMLLSVVCFSFLSRRERKKHDSSQGHQSETDMDPVESLRYDFSTIEAATNNFSEANVLGEGGFGKVYKGLLPNGQEIAVKRLSKSSTQGGEEFKNEAKVVAKLQHRHLVRLLGFCLQGEEKMLVYEFLPNKSLDYILFDPVKQCILDWTRRYNIITGIVRGIQYLHEDSRLKIVHRDLKASNILLDRDMNPKISDFGMARIFGVDQSQGTTNRIVGTYGCMSPKYAMHGEFSTKSDIFSFGVLLLEIISGKKNNSFYQTGIAEDLLSYAWKLWKNGAPLELMDLTLRESHSPDEVIRCIQIGLLCVQEHPADRPRVAKIVNMLRSDSTLPVPNQPAFFIHSGTDPNMPKELMFGQSSTDPRPESVNEMSISEMDPR